MPGPGRRRVDVGQLGAGEPERGDGLVDGPEGLGPEVVLGDALAAEQQAGRAVVAAARGHGAVEREAAHRPDAEARRRAHHIRPASRGSQRSASSVTLTSWSTTLSACSLTCWIIAPA